MFNRFKWQNVASLTQDGHKYSEYIGHLQDLLQKNDINYILDKKFREDFSTEDMKMVSVVIVLRNLRTYLMCTQIVSFQSSNIVGY